jgi:hypothetical protein
MALELKEGEDYGPYEVELKEIETGTRYELIARTRPPLPSGSLSSKATVTTNFKHIPDFNVTVYGFVPPPVQVRGKLNWPTNSVMEMKQRLWVVHPEDQPIEVTAVKASHDVIEVDFRKADAGDGQVAPIGQYEIVVTLPPGDRIPADAEPSIEILTTSDEPEYQRLVVPIRIINPRGPMRAGGPPPPGSGG